MRNAVLPLTAWLVCVVLSLAAFLAPALWNGFAIVFYDTGGYLSSVLQWKLFPGRSFFYGLFLWLSSLNWITFWAPVVVQSLLTVWVIRLLLRCHGLPNGPLALTTHCFGLALLTGISWYTSQLMPDILVPLMVLAFWLLSFHWPRLSRGERLGLVAMALLAMLSHTSCLALAIGLVVVTVVARIAARWRQWPVQVIILPGLALVLTSLLVMPAVHFILFARAGYTPGGPAFLFGRLVQDGLAQRWLAEHCPAPGIRLCSLQQRLPRTADEFLWADTSPFRDIGSWEEDAEQELRYLVRACVQSYPGAFAWDSIRFTGQQLVKVATGDGLLDHHSATRGVFTGLLPQAAKSYTNARQQQGVISQRLFDVLNWVHVPVACLSVLALPLIAFWQLRTHQFNQALLFLFILSATLGNAFICGALSNPHDRYQSRIVWIAVLVVGMTLASFRQRPTRQQQPLR